MGNRAHSVRAPQLRAARKVRGERERAHQLLQSLYDTSKVLARFDSLATTLPKALELAVAHVACRAAVLVLGQEGIDHLFIWQRHDLPPELRASAIARTSATHARWVQGSPARGQGAGNPSSPPPAFASADEAHVIALPLVVARGTVLGTLALEFTSQPDEAALSFASAFANQLAVAVDRHAAETAVQVSERRFSGIVSLASDAIVAIDDTQCITFFNNGAEEVFGYTRAEALGAPLAMLLPEGLQSAHAAYVRAFANAPEIQRRMGERNTVFGRRKGGERFAGEASLFKQEVAGKWTYTAVLRDISESVRLEQEQRFLAEAGELLASALEYEETLKSVALLAVGSLADCCIIDSVDEHGQARRLEVAMASPERRALGLALRVFPPAGEHGAPAQSVFRTHRAELVATVAPGFHESVATCPEHLRLMHELAPTSVMAVPVVSRGELLVVITFMSTDGERHYGPKDLALAEELARRAGVALDNARLYERARQATRDREDLLAVVSHDLRTPLNNISMGMGILLSMHERPEDAAARGLLERIERGAQGMGRLIGDLLNSASIQAGRLSVTPVSLSVAALIEDALEAQRALATKKRVRLQNDAPSGLPNVLGDAARLQQVLGNLIGNALKYAPAGGAVTLMAEQKGALLHFSVTDTGPGIAAADLPQLFNRFWQVKRTARLGTGLGLYIAKGIVEALGGQIWAVSVVGAGSTFHFTLPLAG